MNTIYEITIISVLFIMLIISVFCVAFPLKYLQIWLWLPVFISEKLPVKLGKESKQELEELYKSPEIFLLKHYRYIKMIQLCGWGGILIFIGLMSMKFF